MSYRFRRRVVRRLDTLIIGANPDKLRAQTEILGATPRPAVPLSEKERRRLDELNNRALYAGPLTPQEYWEREQLRARVK